MWKQPRNFLLSVAGKILANILLKRLIQHVSEDLMPETQCGFRQNRSTSDMIFAARQILEKSREQYRDLHMCFIDLSKAFDTVERSMLWEVLRRSGCPEKFVSLIRQIHDGMEARVKVSDLESEPFGVSRGVKQGCTLAPVLFNLYITYITRLLGARVGPDCGVSLNYRMDRSLFDLQKLKARTKIKKYLVPGAAVCRRLCPAVAHLRGTPGSHHQYHRALYTPGLVWRSTYGKLKY